MHSSLILDDSECSDTEDFNNSDLLDRSIASGIFLKEYLTSCRSSVLDFLSTNDLTLNNGFFKSTSLISDNIELDNYESSSIDEIPAVYDYNDIFEYNETHINTLGETPNIFDFVDEPALAKYSNKAIFSKLENFFLILSYRELESARYFKFNDNFLNVGSCNFSKNTLFDNNYFNKLLLNDFEFNKLTSKHIYLSSDESSLDFLDYDNKNIDSKLQYFNIFNKSADLKRNVLPTHRDEYNFFIKSIFTVRRELYYDKYGITYNNLASAGKINFKKLFLLAIFNKKIKNNIYHNYFFKFNKLTFKQLKKNNYIFFSCLLKNSNLVNFKKLLKGALIIKKFKKSKNIKLLSEFS